MKPYIELEREAAVFPICLPNYIGHMFAILILSFEIDLYRTKQKFFYRKMEFLNIIQKYLTGS